MKIQINFLSSIFFISAFIFNARAQDTVRNVRIYGKLDSINSLSLKQKRFVEVFLPPSYKPTDSDKYDVLYVLDGGNWNTSLVVQEQRFIEAQERMPPAIIVSIMGIDRNVELTPTHLKSWQAQTGGAADFLSFLKNELIPYINKAYPSNGMNTLWGHSLGGMFAMYTLLNEPTTFKSYVLADPSVWWDDCYVPKMAAKKLPALASLDATLFIGACEGPPFHDLRIDTMNLILKKMTPAGLNWKLVTYPDETHSSVRLKTIYDGLKFTYKGYVSKIEFDPMNGIVLKDKAYQVWCTNDTTGLYYTTDGTEPTRHSLKANLVISLTGAAKLTYKRFTNRSNYDKKATGKFSVERLFPPASKPRNAKSGGFNYNYYEGEQAGLRDLKNLKPLRTGIVDEHFDGSKLPRTTNYALVMNGWLEAEEDGYYVFYLRADKGAKLYINGKLIIQWADDFNGQYYSYLLPLSKGYHPVRLEYFAKNQDYNLALYYLTPNMSASKDPIPIPFDKQYGRK